MYDALALWRYWGIVYKTGVILLCRLPLRGFEVSQQSSKGFLVCVVIFPMSEIANMPTSV